MNDLFSHLSPAPLTLQALVGRIIDFAGIFPPAKQPLALALSEYGQYQKAPTNWLLGRFLANPVTLLEALQSPHRLSLVMPIHAAEETRELLEQVGADSRSRIEMLEFRAKDTLDLNNHFDALQAFYDKDFEAHLLPIYVELESLAASPLSGWRDQIAQLAEVARKYPQMNLALKIRCGGGPDDKAPSAEQVHAAFDALKAAQLAVKFTGGLHHAFATETPVGSQLGFLTLFLAGAFFHAGILEQAEELLAETDSARLNFTETSVTWRSPDTGIFTISLEQIQKARCSFIRSFGSCSFEEPVESLASTLNRKIG